MPDLHSADLTTTQGTTRIEPWSTERPLFVLNLVVALALWGLSIVSIVGLVYAVVISVVLIVMHLSFVAHLRGSAIRVTTTQLPEIHAAVTRLSARFGMPVPETHVIHGGGALNAFATRFGRRDMVILLSDLLDACEGNEAARDMIIAHELGHLHRGHLRWNFLIAPAMLVPFLGTALSRAREYTCDRYGLAGAGNPADAAHGLTVLAAGARLARRVDRRAFADQRADLNTGLMTLGEWLSTHPALSKRLVELDPALRTPEITLSRSGGLRAAAIVAAVVTPILVAGVAASLLAPQLLENGQSSRQRAEYEPPAPEVADRQAHQDLERLAAFVHEEDRAGRGLPWDGEELYARWRAAHPHDREPLDPYDGYRYGYEQKGEHFRLWSSGPDEAVRRPDLTYDSRRPPVSDERP
jgi:Zn-dependent protease with chaperone function